MRQLQLILLSSICTACASGPTPPRYESIFGRGSARSDDADTSRMLGMIGSTLTPEVCELLRVEAQPPFVIWHMPEMPAGGLLVARSLTGEITQRWIELGDFAVQYQPRFAVAHELVHWYARGVWDTLPHAVEEGLADRIALVLAPEWRLTRESELELQLADLTPERRARALALTERTWHSADAQARQDAYAVGFEIVQRLGIDRVHAMCTRAAGENRKRVPVSWLAAPDAAQAAGSVQNFNTWSIRAPLTSASR